MEIDSLYILGLEKIVKRFAVYSKKVCVGGVCRASYIAKHLLASVKYFIRQFLLYKPMCQKSRTWDPSGVAEV